MDIAGISIGMHQATLQNSIQLSVMKMAMNGAEVNSSETINMIDDMAVEQYKGEYIDATV